MERREPEKEKATENKSPTEFGSSCHLSEDDVRDGNGARVTPDCSTKISRCWNVFD
jgi:hypothetical protein